MRGANNPLPAVTPIRSSTPPTYSQFNNASKPSWPPFVNTAFIRWVNPTYWNLAVALAESCSNFLAMVPRPAGAWPRPAPPSPRPGPPYPAGTLPHLCRRPAPPLFIGHLRPHPPVHRLHLCARSQSQSQPGPRPIACPQAQRPILWYDFGSTPTNPHTVASAPPKFANCSLAAASSSSASPWPRPSPAASSPSPKSCVNFLKS